MSRLYLVHLRKPQTSDPNEKRSDPFWEFGSFGCTGCHNRNLLHERNLERIKGARLGFAQNGPRGFVLLLVTPPIRIESHANTNEARWTPPLMPLRYDAAPLLIDRDANTHFPSLLPLFIDANRSTPVARFSSAFRSRATPVDPRTARSVLRKFDRLYATVPKTSLAACYLDALPFAPNAPDYDRQRTYGEVRRNARGKPGKKCRSTASRVRANRASKQRRLPAKPRCPECGADLPESARPDSNLQSVVVPAH